jgi:small subunit ribosomal protein S9
MSEATINSATGRRKNAIAHIWLTEGTGQITINDRLFEEYLGTVQLQNVILKPFQASNLVNKFNVRVVAKGGGINGQAGAISLAISRALTKVNPDIRAMLKPQGLLTRDPRMKERKKAGQPGARKRFQFSKR